ncbi:MAG: hypothetical protein R3E95_06755 [Thiolinea sp.]
MASENIRFISPEKWRRKEKKRQKLETLQGRWIGINELCEKLGMSRTTYYRRKAAGKIPKPSTQQGQQLWYEPEIDKMLANEDQFYE